METLQRTANRGSVSTGYDVANSVKLEADNTEYLTRDVSSAGNRDVGTISMWIKRTEIGTAQYLFTFGNTDNDNGRTFARFQTDDTLRIGGGQTVWRNTNRVFRDTSAWMHIVIAFDTTQSTANDRFKLYINGVQETSFSTTNNPSQNDDLGLNFEKQVIGYNSIDNGSPFAGYMCEICYQDGTASAHTEFGEFDSDTGIWKPIDVASKPSGTNKFYLDFEDSSNLGNDVSGGTDFTENNIAAADQATDTCTNNFCTFNTLIPGAGTFSEGATKFWNGSGNGWKAAVASMGAGTSGKWYAEFNFPTTAANNMLGQCPIDDPDLNRGEASFPYYGSDTSLDESTGVYSNDGDRYIGGGAADYGTAYGTSDIMSIAIDMDNGKFYVAKNGTYFNSGDPTSGATGTGALDVRGATKAQSIGPAQYTSNAYMLCNYGGYTTISISSAASDANGYGTFEYAPPSGYYALCTKNLAEYG